MTVMIKCADGLNPYSIRMSMINNNECGNECPRCSKIEIWEYIIKCRKTIPLRREFIKILLKELNSSCPNNIE